jgi:flagellar FliL protein
MAQTGSSGQGTNGMKLVIVGAIALAVAGGAGGYVAARSRSGWSPAADPDRPKLALRQGVKASEMPLESTGSSPDPRKVKSSYYEMAQPFTSNLSGSDSIVQLSIGVSTFYDNKVLDNFKDNELPIRSAMINTLAKEDPYELKTTEGKAALRRRLRDEVNRTLIAKTGYGGIDDVYFTSFVSQ